MSAHPAPSVIAPATMAAVRSFAISVIPFYKHLTATELEVTTIKGGTTNSLYMLQSIGAPPAPSGTSSPIPASPNTTSGYSDQPRSDAAPTKAVVRVYGRETNKIISREEELFWQGQFLETYGRNEEMLAYEYLEGFRALEAHELPPKRLQIARRLSAFHAKGTQASVFSTIPMENVNHTMMMLTKWVELVADIDTVRSAVAPEKRELFDRMGWADGGLMRERDWLVSVIERNKKRLPTAVCHNDLTCGNFMINENVGEEELRFIDFEYARLNFVYFDFANHFNEYGGLECDFSRFPERSIITEFVREYLEAGRKGSVIAGYVGINSTTLQSSDNSQTHERGASILNFGATPPSSYEATYSMASTTETHHSHDSRHHQRQQQMQREKYLSVSDAEVETATDLVLFFTLISHFVWAVWALVQEQVSDIDFGFMDYGWARWSEYMKNKEQFSKNVA